VEGLKRKRRKFLRDERKFFFIPFGDESTEWALIYMCSLERPLSPFEMFTFVFRLVLLLLGSFYTFLLR
jgi:hypothetical protein